MRKLKIVYKPINEVIPYANNARTHDQNQIDQIKASITEFGMNTPIGIHNNTIVYGHGRIEALKQLGQTEVPTVDLSDLSEAQKKAYILADNRMALNAGWDVELLKLEMESLDELDFDLSLTGFDDDEIMEFLKEDLDPQSDEDAVPDMPLDPISKLGDIWILGNHRVMCGDSTSIDAVESLMDGNKVDLLFTDPPYNVAFNGRSGKHDVIKNDNLSDADFESFISDVIQTIKLIDPAVYYIWCNWKFYGILQGQLEYKSCIVWAKNVFGLGRGYRHQHEFCLFNGKVDEEIKNESDLWEIKKDSNYMHPTQKPVALSVRAFGNHIKLLNVLDLFGGSGSTLIGAEQTGRKAHLMELDPKYVDVIVQRWQDYTGKEATLESTDETFNELNGGE